MEGPGAGWYPDPWAGGHHRYWDGTAWTGDSFPNVPGWSSEPAMTPPELPRGTPPPPQWTPAAADQMAPPGPAAPTQVWPPEEPAKAGPVSAGAGFIVLVVVMMLVVGSLATAGAYYAFGRRAKSTPSALRPTPATLMPVRPNLPRTPVTPAPSTDPSASVLSGLVLSLTDVIAPVVVQTDPDGDGLAAPTLDLCAGTFPSESSRTARLQVSAADSRDSRFLSTEAVLYADPAATAQGFTELKAVAAGCSTAGTHFNPAPDAKWPAVATVDRLAFDLVETDVTGAAQHVVAVYLRRGRVLMGVYFDQPDGPQQSVAGETTLAGIANVFANRMAHLPTSVTG